MRTFSGSQPSRLVSTAALLLLLACPGEGGKDSTDTGGPGDTGDTGDSGPGDSGDSGSGDGYLFATSDDASGAFVASVGPVMLFTIDLFTLSFMEGDCPAVVETDTEFSATGDCTDDDGITWTGSLRMVSAETADGGEVSVTYDNWGTDDGTDVRTTTGHLVITAVPNGEGDLVPSRFETSDLVATSSGTVEFSLSYSSFTADGVDIVSTVLGEPGTIDASGSAVATGGSFDFTASYAVTRACAAEWPTTGSAVFNGANVLTLTMDGDSDCDGCTPWSTSDGLSGEICAE